MATKAQFTLEAAKRIADATRRVEAQALSLSGQQQPFYRPGTDTPHKATAVSTTGITVGLGRSLSGRAPEIVYISYRGAVIEIAKATAEALTGITASGYVVYEVVCTAGTWTATAAFSTTLTGLTDTGKIYIPIAKVTCAGSVITAVYQQLWDNPTVHIGSPQYSITVDANNGRMQLVGDAVPAPHTFYGVNGDGQLGWWDWSLICSYCAGDPPDSGEPCGPCEDAPACVQIDGFDPYMFDLGGCLSGSITYTTPWDGKLYKVETASGICRYESGLMGIDDRRAAAYLVRYLDSSADPAACYWQLTIVLEQRTGPGCVVWQGTATGTDPDVAITRTAGTDSTATLTLEQCLRTIRVTISGVAACDCVRGRQEITAGLGTVNAVFEIVESAPGSGEWNLEFGAFTSWTIDTFADDASNCGTAATNSESEALNLHIAYDGGTAWTVNGANEGTNVLAYSVFWFYEPAGTGDADGATLTDTHACGVGAFPPLAAGGSMTIEVL